MSMLDRFRRYQPSVPSLARPASYAVMTNLASPSSPSDKPALKRCATTTTSGWGIVPVLNELERRSSTHSLLPHQSPRVKQQLCLNCRRRYFPTDSRRTPGPNSRSSASSSVPLSEQFCSLDCKSSYDCSASTQALVDLQLDASATSSDDDVVITLDDDSDFSL